MMRLNKLTSLAIFIAVLLTGCSNRRTADTLVYNGVIYTLDSANTMADAMIIKDKKIVAIGKYDSISKLYTCKEKIDLGGKAVYPGFIDAHAHFLGYGLQLNTVNLVGTTSWNEVLERVAAFVKEKNIKAGEWVTGRGWDQNDWNSKQFPTNEELTKQYPDIPILLTRIDGHAAIANAKALELAKVIPGQKLIGGTVETKNGKLTGILIDNAVDLVSSVVPAASKEDKTTALLSAQKNCFEVGLTTVDDCGINYDEVELIEALHKDGRLKMKLYAMLSDNAKNYAYLFKRGAIKTDRLTVNGFKVYGDGALGSRGACLLNPYHDRPGEIGFLLNKESYFDSVASEIYKHNLQMCTHAIGDSANRVLLKIYAKYLKGKNDRRWRIEHAQVVNENDFDIFGQYSIVPSVQPTHATSDMYWAADRLGPKRVKNAYAYKRLLQQNGWIPLGTDFPVENINPLFTFYAAVVRKDHNNFPANGYQIENALTRLEALKGMTIWAAKSNFEERDKGSLEIGKYADFVVSNLDIMKCAESDILKMTVSSTWINGKQVWAR